ncbi:MAG TPA: hypothetical protein ENI07_11410 [Desulfobacterales bacterium]|nr:hypothetical protein [Desulfobacterales bacterium]
MFHRPDCLSTPWTERSNPWGAIIKKTIVQSLQMKLLNDLLIISRVVGIGGVLGKEKIHQGADTIDPQRLPGLPSRIKSSVRLNNQG